MILNRPFSRNFNSGLTMRASVSADEYAPASLKPNPAKGLIPATNAPDAVFKKLRLSIFLCFLHLIT
jgi:hypothetical protein